MEVIILPLLPYYFFGQCFDLVDYRLVSVNPYQATYLPDFTIKARINRTTSKFQVVNSPVEMAAFMGMDVVSYWKSQHHLPYPGPSISLLYMPGLYKHNKVRVAVKIIAETMMETIPVTTPQTQGWEMEQSWRGGTHYLRSVTYGSQVFSMFEIQCRGQLHCNQITRDIERKTGLHGIFDENFKAKLDTVVDESNTWYRMSSTFAYGLKPGSYQGTDKLLKLKRNLEGPKSLIFPDSAMLFEFHSLSDISPSFPTIVTNGKLIAQGKLLQSMCEDVDYAIEILEDFLEDNRRYLTDEKYSRVLYLQKNLEELKEDLTIPFEILDVSTLGDIHQFDEAIEKYGSNDTDTYKKIASMIIK